ncbi:hypothetical protein EVAR_7315_1 [Eumeta japonica]|uniref:Uncharacterized protein n=1 Tax=Eumeta variegata TaxID=151549 RepID=A0A4C1T2M3_EUMVA|nr:hypothetical protein EVAR_7315_1 [Eumeta japonica]
MMNRGRRGREPKRSSRNTSRLRYSTSIKAASAASGPQAVVVRSHRKAIFRPIRRHCHRFRWPLSSGQTNSRARRVIAGSLPPTRTAEDSPVRCWPISWEYLIYVMEYGVMEE